MVFLTYCLGSRFSFGFGQIFTKIYPNLCLLVQSPTAILFIWPILIVRLISFHALMHLFSWSVFRDEFLLSQFGLFSALPGKIRPCNSVADLSGHSLIYWAPSWVMRQNFRPVGNTANSLTLILAAWLQIWIPKHKTAMTSYYIYQKIFFKNV